MPTVCCVGDSITIGAFSTSGLGWRDKLRVSQPAITYVGTQGSGDHLHEAYSGLDIQQIRATATANILAAEPEICIVTVGTNSIPDVEAVPAAHQAAAFAGTLAWHGARVLLCIPPPKSGGFAAAMEEFTDVLALEFSLMPNVTVVDTNSSLVHPGDFADGLHPNEGGYVKMHTAINAAWPPPAYSLGQGPGHTGAQRTGRGAWTL